MGSTGWRVDDPATAPLIDLVTGAFVPWSRAPDTSTGVMGSMQCGLYGCTGRRDMAGSRTVPTTAFLHRRDGSGYVEIGDKGIAPVGEGRFLTLEYDPPAAAQPWPPRRMVVWDRQSGQAALCPVISPDDGIIRPDQLEYGRPFVVWPAGDSLKLPDITKIN
jgi:hypothetical protein